MKICYKCNKEKDESTFCMNRSKKDGLDIYCKDCIKEGRSEIRKRCFDHYGPHCKFCGTSFDLQLDHVDGNGSSWRRQMSGRNRSGLSSTGLYHFLAARDFPTGFQVLCRKCNIAKGQMSNDQFYTWVKEMYANIFSKQGQNIS